MFNIIESITDEKKNRTYYLAETALGRILYFRFADCTQWRNLTRQDFLWTVDTNEVFNRLFENNPVTGFRSKRLVGMSTINKVQVKSGDVVYHLCEKKVPDGFLYEIPATYLRLFSKKNYPDLEFNYTRYHIETIKRMDLSLLQKLKTEEVVRENEGWYHSESLVSDLCAAVKRYADTYMEKENLVRV